MTASFVVGDTLTSSVTALAYSRYGPIDEVITVLPADAALLQTRMAGLSHPDIDGSLEISTLDVSTATLSSNGSNATAASAAPRAQLLELDFAKASVFGGDAKATGIMGAGPAEGEAVVLEALANRLHIRAGDSFTAFALGNQVKLRVQRVIRQTGLAGFWRGREVLSYNAFVAPGTIRKLAAGVDVQALASGKVAKGSLPLFMVAISNRGGVESGAAHTKEVSAELEKRLKGLRTNISPVKQTLLDAARKAGESLQQLYQTIGSFAVFAGILLLINIFTMLADERKSELGMMRAMGLKRRSLVATFASEGWLYAIVASAIGTVVGLGIGRLVVEGAGRIASSGSSDLRTPINFHFTPSSLQNGFVIGLFIAIATVVGTSISTSRFNIISAIRDLERSKVRGGKFRSAIGSLVGLSGLALAVGGFAAKQATTIMAGPALLALGVATFLNRKQSHRLVLTLCAGFAVVWGAAGVPIAIGVGAAPSPTVFLIQGLILVIPSVMLLSEYQNEVGHGLARITGRRLAMRLGLAYPLARKQRTALTLAQFSIVVFILTYISVISSMFEGQAAAFTKDLGGGYNVVLDSNPIDVGELKATAGVTAVAPIVHTERASVTPRSTKEATEWPMAGIDESFLNVTPPRLTDTGKYPTQRAAYEALIASDHFAIVDDRFLSRQGPPAAVVGIGDKFTVKDPTSGTSRELTVIAKSANDLLFNGGWTSAKAMRAIFPTTALASRAYISTTNPDAFVAAIEARDFRKGASAVTISGRVNEQLAQQVRFFGLIRSFLSLGLVVGIAGIGVIMVRAVRERRRQVGVLRALGFQANSVSNAFAIEAGFVAAEGIIIGVALGLISCWTLTLSESFGQKFTFVVPVGTVVLLMFATMVGSLAATIGPARSAAKIKPAVALRITD